MIVIYEKVTFSLFAVLVVPVFCSVTKRLLPNADSADLFVLILYPLLALWCLRYLWKKSSTIGICCLH